MFGLNFWEFYEIFKTGFPDISETQSQSCVGGK